ERGHWRRPQGFTSGTTGSPLAVRRSVRSILFEEAFVQWHRGQFGWTPLTPTVIMRGDLLRGGTGGIPARVDPLNRHLYLSSFHRAPTTVAQYLDRIASFGGAYLAAYPSSVVTLCTLAVEAGLEPPKFDVIFTSSENLSTSQRRFLSEATGARVIDYYGNAERTVAAGQCIEGTYHFFPTYSRLHLPSDQTGAIIAT